jgi:phospholipid/cholesterol/gamma-HCH transport system ATP-binding protein
MAQSAIIAVKDLVARYGDEVILDNISFEILEGEILVILGPSGCGKTTLLRHLIGLNTPFAGQILIEGVDITTCDEKAFHQALRKVGVLFQSSALFGSMTLAENVALPIVEYSGLPRRAVSNLVRMKLCQFELEKYDSYLPSEISGGMKKRAGLARALALSPKILFLDEPTAGLDPIKSAEIDQLLLNINRAVGTTLVIITHELESIFSVASRVIMLDKGHRGIIADGDPRFLKDNSQNSLVRRFLNRDARPQTDNRM